MTQPLLNLSDTLTEPEDLILIKKMVEDFHYSTSQVLTRDRVLALAKAIIEDNGNPTYMSAERLITEYHRDPRYA